jgi:hypothetical protein
VELTEIRMLSVRPWDPQASLRTSQLTFKGFSKGIRCSDSSHMVWWCHTNPSTAGQNEQSYNTGRAHAWLCRGGFYTGPQEIGGEIPGGPSGAHIDLSG